MTPTDGRAELHELVRATRALLESLDDSGAEYLPSAPPRSTAEAAAGARLEAAPRVPTAAHGVGPARREETRLEGGRAAPTAGEESRFDLVPREPARERHSPFEVSALQGDSAPGGAPEGFPLVAATAREPAAPAPRVRLASDERRRRLGLLAEEVATCTACPLHATRNRTAFARGNPDAELVFVGEGPGTQEDAEGEPFVGPAGQLLDKMIAAMGLGRDDVYVMNVVKCRPFEPDDPRKDRKPSPEELAACRPFFDRQLELLEPKAMVALGATAAQALTGVTTGITRLRGTWRLYRGRIPLMPTFHPAYLLRSPEHKREVWDDLQQVMRRLGKAPPGKPR